MLSISTAWNHKPETTLQKMLEDVQAVGLNTIELGYRVTALQLEEIIPLLVKMKMNVSSVHNFCPLPNDSSSPRHPSNYYRLSALDEQERRQAVKWTKKAIDTASRVSCGVVVIHAGTVEMEDDPTELLRAYKSGCAPATDFIRIKDKILQEREKNKGPYLKAVARSLDEITGYAGAKKIKIGLETRYYPTEIPDFQEIGDLLQRYDSSVLGYWHDVGHGEVNVRLGIVKNHRDYFDRYGGRLIGVHIHGVDGLKDHQAPFTGDFDLNPILPYLKNNDLTKVIESHSSATIEQIKEAVRKLS